MDNQKYKLLLDSASAYYSGKTYLISDREYDQLYNECLNENPDFNIFKEIGYIKPSDSDNVHHMIDFPAFKKSYISDGLLPCELLSDAGWKEYIDPMLNDGGMWFYKYDGCSLILYYDPATGTLQNIVTRSDEVIGKNRFNNFIRLVPKQIPTGIRAILCEVMVPLKHGFNFTSRNKANGLTSSKYKIGEINELCTIVGCDIVFGDIPVEIAPNQWQLQPKYTPSTRAEIYEIMKTIPNKAIDGRVSFHIASPVDISKMDSYSIKELVTADQVTELLEYRVDGIVLYSDNHVTEALKAYYVDSADTTITNITWARSEKEIYVPTATIDPIELEGTTINYVAVNAATTMIANGYAVGARIKVARIGMTIPQIIKNYDSHLVADLGQCNCGHKFTEADCFGPGLLCPNPDCYCKVNTRMAWYGGLTRSELITRLKHRPSDWIVAPLNLSNYTTPKVHWEDADLDKVIECIDTINEEGFIELINKYYKDLNTENRKRVVQANAKSLLIVYNKLK